MATFSELWNAAYDRGLRGGLDPDAASMYADTEMQVLFDRAVDQALEEDE